MNRPLRGPWLLVARTAWVTLVCLTLVVFILGCVNIYRSYSHVCAPVRKPDCLPLENLHLSALAQHGLALYSLGTVLIIALPWLAMGCLVFLRRSDSPAQLLMSLGLATGWATDLSNHNIRFHFFDEVARWPGLTPIGLIVSYLVSFASQVSAIVMAHLIPNGQFISPWSIWFTFIWAVQTAINTFYRYPFEWFQGSVGVDILDQAFAVIAPLSAIVIIWFRYRFFSEQLAKLQLKSILPSALTLLGVYTLFTAWSNIIWSERFADADTLRFASHFIQSGVQSVCAAWFGFSVGAAILRFNFFGAKVVVSRTLVYGGLTLCLLSVYLLVVFGIGALLGITENFWLLLAATALITGVFQPLHTHFKTKVNRLLYGGRSTARKTFAPLSEQVLNVVEPEEILPNIAKMIGRQLALPYVNISVNIAGDSDTEKISARVGVAGLLVERFPLLFRHESLGWLEVSLQPGEVLDAEEHRFIEGLAEEVAMIVKSLQVATELQTVRQHLVMAREAERRELQRDLHDGLGPALGAQTLMIGSVRRLLETDPQVAERLLGELERDMQGTLERVRQLVYRLRPPDLDQLGLVGALAPKLRELVGEQLKLELVLPDPATTYPAAVEVAAYRIVLEAVSNVVQNPQARSCRVELRVTDTALEIDVTDNGQSRDAPPLGVGLVTMRERAQELGGRFSVTQSRLGRRVWASLPLFQVKPGSIGVSLG